LTAVVIIPRTFQGLSYNASPTFLRPFTVISNIP
jgi:hypothetical protein